MTQAQARILKHLYGTLHGPEAMPPQKDYQIFYRDKREVNAAIILEAYGLVEVCGPNQDKLYTVTKG